jgi:hypothetical protein
MLGWSGRDWWMVTFRGKAQEKQHSQGQQGIETTEAYLHKLCNKFFLIEAGLGEKFDSIFAAIHRRGLHRCGIIKLETTRTDGVILGRRRAGKDLANEVDYGIATSSKFSNDLEFPSRVFVICDVRLLGRLVGDDEKGFT